MEPSRETSTPFLSSSEHHQLLYLSCLGRQETYRTLPNQQRTSKSKQLQSCFLACARMATDSYAETTNDCHLLPIRLSVTFRQLFKFKTDFVAHLRGSQARSLLPTSHLPLQHHKACILHLLTISLPFSASFSSIFPNKSRACMGFWGFGVLGFWG